MEVAEPDNYLEFLDLKRKWENGKIMVDVHSKPTNSFTYVLPTACYTGKSIETFHIVQHYDFDEFVIQIKNLNIGVKNMITT